MSTLMRPYSHCSLAFPDCHKYFLSTQLMTVAWWISPDLFSSSTTLEAAVTGSLEVLKFLIFRGPLAPHETTASMLTTLRAWKVGPCPPLEGLWT